MGLAFGSTYKSEGGDESMATAKTERVEIELPRDIIFAMRGLQKPEEVKKKLKIALAIFLFQE